ncbi:hypothetical protein MRB53_021351 [Persea americana]|uniref:Uncharacterized protein n=1 Tax=Persea americana TaxID=3435 RepID=A0ACC2L3M4_PERAE|nr:hypothetical protein MRB53_021351 [Persea americana]
MGRCGRLPAFTGMAPSPEVKQSRAGLVPAVLSLSPAACTALLGCGGFRALAKDGSSIFSSDVTILDKGTFNLYVPHKVTHAHEATTAFPWPRSACNERGSSPFFFVYDARREPDWGSSKNSRSERYKTLTRNPICR